MTAVYLSSKDRIVAEASNSYMNLFRTTIKDGQGEVLASAPCGRQKQLDKK